MGRPGKRQAVGGKVFDQKIKGRVLAVDDDRVAVEKDGRGTDHSGAFRSVTNVSP